MYDHKTEEGEREEEEKKKGCACGSEEEGGRWGRRVGGWGG